MKVDLVKNEKGQVIGWEMSGENPEEIRKLGAIRDLQFWGCGDTNIEYDGRRESDDPNNNPGILKWVQKRETSSYKRRMKEAEEGGIDI